MDIIRKAPNLPEHRPPRPSVGAVVQASPRHGRTHVPPALPAKAAKEPARNRTARRPPFRKLKALLFLGAFLILAWGGYFCWKIVSVSRTVRIDNAPASALSDIRSLAGSFLASDRRPLRGEEDGRVNILLLGKAGERYPGRDLTDTVMVMSLDTRNRKVALLSLPRDLYVKAPGGFFQTKINAMYQYGLGREEGAEPVRQAVQDVTGLPLHYFFIIDFDGFEKVVDTLGGVNVEVMRDIYDPRYPGPNYSYQTFEIRKGWHKLDGATALKYVRERHDDPEGDFGRAKRQQQVIQAVKNKAFSLQTFANPATLDGLLDVLGESVRTDIAPDEIESFIALAKQTDTHNITNVVVDAWKPDSLLRVSHVQVGPTAMFILLPRVGNWSEVRDLAAHLFDLNALRRREEEMKKENATVAVVNLSDEPALTHKVRNLLKDSLHFTDVSVVVAPSSKNQDRSAIVDKTGRSKPFTLDEMLKKFPAALEEQPAVDLPEKAAGSDFVFILGNDLKETLGFAEDSAEDFRKAEDRQDALAGSAQSEVQ
jgi:LCP family protein required for cell wall assembly